MSTKGENLNYMRFTSLLIPSAALFALTCACSHKNPVASTPAPPVTASNGNTTARATATPQTRTNTPARQQTAQANTGNGRITPAERQRLNESLGRLEDALFDYDKSTIRPDAIKALQDDTNVIKTTLAKYPTEKITIEGHTDERGSAEYNLGLGDRRAEAAKDFLTNLGVSPSQLAIISYGKDRPVCTEQTEDCYQKNRRAHLVAQGQ